MRWFPLIVSAIALTACAGAKDDDLSADDAKQVLTAYQGEDYDKVIELTRGIRPDSKWKQLRGLSFQKRGEKRFREEADMKGAIADFDAVIELYPEQDPHHWQRGLAYYYAEDYEKGKAQFERHQTVNSQDVENAVWHFLCAVRVPGGSVEKAREDFIEIERDQRIPMKEVHALFAGTSKPEAVLDAARPDDDQALSDEERNHLCYAHLYLGLYHEAMGEPEKSAEHIRQAAFDYHVGHYMGDVAVVHAKLRGIEKEKADKGNQ